MIAAQELLAELRGAGLRIRLDGDRLFVGPEELLTPGLRSAIREHKTALLLLLSCPDDAQVEALAAREWDEPPDWVACRGVSLRQSVLLEIEPGKWFACDQSLVEWSRRWNEEARAKWLKEHPNER